MASLAVPRDTASHRRPLSHHGLPRAPKISSPNRSPQVSSLGFQHQSFNVDLASPRSPGPLSPPMSAKSFGTFIDSEPSTPAYSPRMDYGWDGNSLVLLRPMSSSSEPASPIEPAWDMMSPVQIPTHSNSRAIEKSRAARVPVEAKPVALQPAPPASQRRKPSRDIKDIKIVAPSTPKIDSEPLPETARPEQTEPTSEEKPKEGKSTSANTAPLNKLASKMKSMLRRRSAGEPKKEKKQKDYYDVDRMEDVHWTEY